MTLVGTLREMLANPQGLVLVEAVNAELARRQWLYRLGLKSGPRPALICML